MVARMKSKVSITVPWRPLYECVREAYMQPLNAYTGIQHHQMHPPLATLLTLCPLVITSLHNAITLDPREANAVSLTSKVHPQITQAFPSGKTGGKEELTSLAPADCNHMPLSC